MTVDELLRRALVLARVLAEGEPAPGAMQTDALETLNDMLGSWQETGIDLGVSELELGEDINLSRSNLHAIRYNLAAELTGEYKTPLDPRVEMHARAGMTRLANTAMGELPATFDRALWRTRTYDINEA